MEAAPDLPNGRYRSVYPAILAIIFGLLYLTALDRPVLAPWQESRQAEISRQLVVAATPLKPSLNGDQVLLQSPLQWWVQAAGYTVLGASTRAARLPTAVAGLTLIILFYLAVKKPLGAGTAMRGCLILGSSLLFSLLCRLATGDLLTGLTIIGVLLGFWSGSERQLQGRPSPWPYWAGYGCGGLALLAAGPAGLLLPAVILLLYTTSLGRPLLLFRHPYLWPGPVILVLVGYGWYLPLALNHPDGLNHSLALLRQHHQGPWFAGANWFPETPLAYPLLIMAGLLPWIGYLPFGFTKAAFWNHRQPSARLIRLGLLTIGAAAATALQVPGAAPVLAVVSLPWLAVITSLGFLQTRLKPRLFGRVATSSTGLLLLAVGLTLAVSPWLLAYLPDILDRSSGSLAVLAAEPPAIPAAWLAAFLPVGCGLALLGPGRPSGGAPLFTTLLLSALILCGICFFVILPYLDRTIGRPPVQLAMEADRQLPDGEPIVVVGLGNHPALGFASGRRIVGLEGSPEQLRAQLSGKVEGTVLGITDRYRFSRLQQTWSRLQTLRQNQNFVLFQMEFPQPQKTAD